VWQADGCSETAIKAFLYNFEKLTSGANLMIPESSLSPVDSLPSYESLSEEKPELLKETVMLKLNGGLGTGMGLEKAKSLLPLKGEDTFLDFIAKQVALTRSLRSLHPASLPPCTPAAPACPPPPPLPRGPCQVAHMRQSSGVDLAFMLMNSFATSADTLAHLSKYDLAPPRCRWRQRCRSPQGAPGGRPPPLPGHRSALARLLFRQATQGLPLEFVQNKAPKVTEDGLAPAAWPAKPDCEWCPHDSWGRKGPADRPRSAAHARGSKGSGRSS
jgi:UTP--glucose-1-phosphate uridylyltransferase